MFKFKKGILIIHGFGGGMGDVEYFVNFLKENTKFELHPIVLPGHDQKVLHKIDYSEWIRFCEEYLLQILDRYDTIYILGFSMGGVIASHLAAKYPKIKKVVLVSAAFKYLTGGVLQKDLRLMLSREQKNENKDLLYGDILTIIKRVRPGAMLEFTRLVNELIFSIRYVHQPLLILHGLEDEVVPLSSSEFALKEAASHNKSLVKVKHGRHGLFQGSRQKEVSHIVLKFLKGGKITDEFI